MGQLYPKKGGQGVFCFFHPKRLCIIGCLPTNYIFEDLDEFMGHPFQKLFRCRFQIADFNEASNLKSIEFSRLDFTMEIKFKNK